MHCIDIIKNISENNIYIFIIKNFWKYKKKTIKHPPKKHSEFKGVSPRCTFKEYHIYKHD